MKKTDIYLQNRSTTIIHRSELQSKKIIILREVRNQKVKYFSCWFKGGWEQQKLCVLLNSPTKPVIHILRDIRRYLFPYFQ